MNTKDLPKCFSEINKSVGNKKRQEKTQGKKTQGTVLCVIKFSNNIETCPPCYPL